MLRTAPFAPVIPWRVAVRVAPLWRCGDASHPAFLRSVAPSVLPQSIHPTKPHPTLSSRVLCGFVFISLFCCLFTLLAFVICFVHCYCLILRLVAFFCGILTSAVYNWRCPTPGEKREQCGVQETAAEGEGVTCRRHGLMPYPSSSASFGRGLVLASPNSTASQTPGAPAALPPPSLAVPALPSRSSFLYSGTQASQLRSQ